MTLPRKSNSHRIVIEFDDGCYTKRLIHPEGGCTPATQCGNCGHDTADTETTGCYDCKDGFGTECWVQGWFDNEGADLLRGEIEVEVDPEWDQDHCILHIVPAKVAQ